MPYPARDLDKDDLWLLERMARSGKTVDDVAIEFKITHDQVWSFLNQRYREQLLSQFRENQGKKE